MLKSGRPKVYYGWWIVLAGFVSQAIAAGLLQRSYGAYIVLLRDSFGCSKAALSAAFSMQQVENGLLGPIQGWLIDRFGRKRIMVASIFLYACSPFAAAPSLRSTVTAKCRLTSHTGW